MNDMTRFSTFSEVDVRLGIIKSESKDFVIKEDNLIISVKEKKESKGARSFLEVYLCTNGAMSVYRNYI